MRATTRSTGRTSRSRRRQRRPRLTGTTFGVEGYSVTPSCFLELFDISGKTAERTTSHEFLTVAGIAVHVEAASSLREAARPLTKWTSSDAFAAAEAAHLVETKALVCLTMRVHKANESWRDFWEKAKDRHARLTRISNKSTPFAKAGNVLKYWLFGECSARLTGELVRRIGRPTLSDHRGLAVLDLAIVCDADIEGDENIEAFTDLWRGLERKQPLVNRMGLSIRFRSIDLKTEQEEPGLVLVDHLAGAVQAYSTSGAVAVPKRFNGQDLKRVEDLYRNLPNLVSVEYEFDIDYDWIFREAGEPVG